jgi:hypothetical protein
MRLRGWWWATGGGLALVGLLAGGGLWGGAAALAQSKPPPLGAPAVPQPPPPAARPAPPSPAPQGDKFAAPPPAPPGATRQVDKFGLPPAAGGAPPPALAVPGTPPPDAAPPPPADEHETVRRFRALLGPEARLSYAAAEVVDPARGAVRLREVVLRRPDRSAAIAELTLDGLRDDGVAEAVARGVALREGDGGGGGAPTATIERVRIVGLTVRRPAPGEAPRPDGLELDSLRIEGLGVAGGTPVAIASLLLEDYGVGRAGRLSLEGLEVRGVASAGGGMVDRVSLGRVTLRGLDLAATLAALVAKDTPPRPAGAYALEAEDLALGGPGGRRIATLAGLRALGDQPSAGGGGPETGRFALRELRVEPFPGLEEWLRRFGYAALNADLTAESQFDRATGRLEMSPLSLAARDMGALALTMVLDGVTPDTKGAEAMRDARLVSLSLRYLDQSLYGRFVRQQAQQMRQPEARVREQMAAQAAGALTAGGKDAEAMAAIRAAVQRFLRGEAREIEIAARPPEPVALQDMAAAGAGGPVGAVRMLGLTATAR